MAIYYNAYIGKKTADGFYDIIGPFVYDKEGELILRAAWWRSQSFIHWDAYDWDARNIPVEKMRDVTYDMCVETNFDKTKKFSYGYWIPAKSIYMNGSCEPIRGYLPVEDASALIESNYNQEYISWGMENKPLAAEFVAGMTDAERSKYSFVSYIDYESPKYHMWELGRILDGYEEYTLIKEDEGEELGIIFQIG